MGSPSLKCSRLDKGNNQNIQVVNQEIKQQGSDLCIKKCGVSKLPDKIVKFILLLENRKYYYMLYKQQEDGNFIKTKHEYCLDNLIIIRQQDYINVLNDRLLLSDVLEFYQTSNDPNTFLSKIVQNVEKDFDAIQEVECDFNNRRIQSNNKKFTSILKVCDEQNHLVFADSQFNYILVELNNKTILKSSQQYVCSQQFNLKQPLNNQNDIIQIIKNFQNVDDLIRELKE